MTTYISDKRRVQLGLMPALIFALMTEAFQASKTQEEKGNIEPIISKAFSLLAKYANSVKLMRRVEKKVRQIISSFVDKRDNTYHVRKVVLCLHGVTQKLIDNGIIDEEIALLVQEALDLENRIPMNDEDWFNLKQSADKKTESVFEIILE